MRLLEGAYGFEDQVLGLALFMLQTANTLLRLHQVGVENIQRMVAEYYKTKISDLPSMTQCA